MASTKGKVIGQASGFLYDEPMEKIMDTHTLYSLAKAYTDAAVASVFSENDLMCVIAQDKTPYYVSLVDSAFAAYRGEKGLTGYLALSLSDEQSDSFEYMEMEQEQECLLCLLNNTRQDIEDADYQAIVESGVPFEDGMYPQFRSKLQYRYPWYIEESEGSDLILILRAVLFAKEYFASYKKTGKTNSFSYWLDSLNLKESSDKEYIPCIEERDGTFIVTAKILQDEAYGFSYPQAFFTDEEKQRTYKRMRSKPGKILYVATGMLPEPLLGEKGGRPLFPIFQLVYDPQAHQILDIFMVEDYEKEHGAFISHLLEIFEKEGKPQAIHCFGKRTLPLLEKIAPQMGIMVVEGGQNEELNSILMDMMHDLFVEEGNAHEHHHHHEEGCSCNHDGEHHHHHGDGCSCDHHHEE